MTRRFLRAKFPEVYSAPSQSTSLEFTTSVNVGISPQTKGLIRRVFAQARKTRRRTHDSLQEMGRWVRAVVGGHFRYYGVLDRSLSSLPTAFLPPAVREPLVEMVATME